MCFGNVMDLDKNINIIFHMKQQQYVTYPYKVVEFLVNNTDHQVDYSLGNTVDLDNVPCVAEH